MARGLVEIQFFQTPCLWLVSEQQLGGAPYLSKQWRVAVGIEVRLAFPDAVGKKYGGIVLVLQQLHVAAAFKAADKLPVAFKNMLKGGHFLGAEAHFYNTLNHKILSAG